MKKKLKARLGLRLGTFFRKVFFFLEKKKDKTKLNGQTNSSIPEAAF